MMGMSTNQIAEVFTMDAAEVVKILEQTEKSAAKESIREGNDEKMTLKVDTMIQWHSLQKVYSTISGF